MKMKKVKSMRTKRTETKSLRIKSLRMKSMNEKRGKHTDERYTNADLKISLQVRVHTKTIP